MIYDENLNQSAIFQKISKSKAWKNEIDANSFKIIILVLSSYAVISSTTL
jgi:hypothetical protein